MEISRSDVIAAIEGYIPSSGIVILRYHDGDRYVYYGVPRARYEALVAEARAVNNGALTASVGRFVNSALKPHYHYDRIEVPA